MPILTLCCLGLNFSTKKFKRIFISLMLFSSCSSRISCFRNLTLPNIPRSLSLISSLPALLSLFHHCTWMNGQILSQTWLSSWKSLLAICSVGSSCLSEFQKNWEWPTELPKASSQESKINSWKVKPFSRWSSTRCSTSKTKLALRQH